MNIQKRIIFVSILMLSIILKLTTSYCANTNENTIESQQESFGVSSFIENSKKYTGEFFVNIDIIELLNSAI